MDPLDCPTRARALALPLALLLPSFLSFAPTGVRADQVVIVREMRGAPGVPFGGTARIVRWTEGEQLREDVTLQMNPLPVNSAGHDGPGSASVPPRPPEAMTESSLWNAADRSWRTWSKDLDVYVEQSEDSLLHASDGSDEMTDMMSEFFGTGAQFVQELTVDVDSSGAEMSIAGVPARSYVIRATGHYYEMEHNVGGSVGFVRAQWRAGTLPGLSPALPRLQDGPARSCRGIFAGFQFMAFPMFRPALKRLDEESAKLPGNVLRDVFYVQAPDSGATAGRPKSTATDTALVYDDRVLEIRTERSDPARYLLPPNLHKREPQPVEVRSVEPARRSSRRAR
jgi:hypothetical protein